MDNPGPNLACGRTITAPGRMPADDFDRQDPATVRPLDRYRNEKRHPNGTSGAV